MKAHEYWSIGALITMLGTFYTGYKGTKSSHKYFAVSSLICMVMAIYSGHKMLSGKRNSRKNWRMQKMKNKQQTLTTRKKCGVNKWMILLTESMITRKE